MKIIPEFYTDCANTPFVKVVLDITEEEIQAIDRGRISTSTWKVITCSTAMLMELSSSAFTRTQAVRALICSKLLVMKLCVFE